MGHIPQPKVQGLSRLGIIVRLKERIQQLQHEYPIILRFSNAKQLYDIPGFFVNDLEVTEQELQQALMEIIQEQRIAKNEQTPT
jgi:hypothetical protein